MENIVTGIAVMTVSEKRSFVIAIIGNQACFKLCINVTNYGSGWMF